MEDFQVIQIVIILGIIVVKFGVIIGTVIYVKNRNERKKREFLEQEERRKMAQSMGVSSGNGH